VRLKASGPLKLFLPMTDRIDFATRDAV